MTIDTRTGSETPRAIVKWLMIPLGAVAVILGLITFWLPLPVGVPLLLVGILILVRHSVLARRIVADASRRHPRFRHLFRQLRGLRRRLGGLPGRHGSSTTRAAVPPDLRATNSVGPEPGKEPFRCDHRPDHDHE